MPASSPLCRRPIPARASSPRRCGAACNGRNGACTSSQAARRAMKCDLEPACRLLDYVDEWQRATDDAGRRAAWDKILQVHADEVFSIGTVNGIRQPVVVGAKVRNVPA